ncbi:hypothetical protein MMIC_P0255 [Mariprofundus micogutta]|uniref:DUF1499 domain-containing protein n=1 Tax=Mariprofundus micogutta TaxID=1921010 RepID=A0A1L8CKA0_9PROT|nr:DUF1499 domain-containing protein [Mariprofundus micogutta]GAV19321.1 hypothetical protein MMIC_P0255 [Mariprofundus micogutta]
MKWLLIIVAVLLVLGLVAYIAMAIQSQKTPDGLGLQQGQLRPCPDSPNCVCSEEHSQSSEIHAIAPVKVADRGWKKMKDIITEQGGVIERDDGLYLHATFTTPVFRYVDDVELRLDEENGLIHIRSASRIGRSDFGVNRSRVERLVQ